MGFFDKITKVMDIIEKVEDGIKDIEKSRTMTDNKNVSNSQKVKQHENIIISASSHIVEAEEYAEDDSLYNISFSINDSFEEMDSSVGEVVMLNTYAPEGQCDSGFRLPYIAIRLDDDVYIPVEDYKKTGTFKGAMELVPLNGTFYFKAKKETHEGMMYFYGLDRCDGFWENSGLCVVYPKSYVGTENEEKLIRVLDEVAESYSEKRIK